ncbi:MAG: PaaI family thioesterase [Terriglobales bacterium]
MKQAKLTARQIRDFLSRIPFNTLLGVKLSRVHRDGVTIECALRHELTNSAGVAHGGVAAAMADVAVGMAINRHFGGKRRITTVEMKINYFRPASEGHIFARARLLRIGSTLSVGSVDLTDTKGNLIGTAIVTYMFLDARGSRTPA